MSSGPGSAQGVPRRRILEAFFWAAVGSVAAALAVPTVGFLLGPLFRRREAYGVRIGTLDALPVGSPQRVEFVVRRRDGWVAASGRRTAWVVRSRDGVRVFDPRCTHLGCAYHWHAQSNQFLCPCHDGVYDIEGRVVSGPPPRPLDTYPVRVEGGVLYVTPTPVRRA